MWIKRFDWVLMSLVLIMTFIGICMIYSADQIQTGRAVVAFHHKRQLAWLALSLGALLVVSLVSTRTMEALAYLAYAATVVGLAAVLMKSGGAEVERWLILPGGIRIQPSELAKITTILALAAYISNRKKRIEGLKDIIVPLILVLLPAGLILRQPDLGTSLVFFFIMFGVLYWSGLRLIYLFLFISPIISFVLALVSLLGEIHLPLLWGLFFVLLCILIFYTRIYLADAIIFMAANLFTGIVTSPLWNSLKPYQQNRILVFLQPERDPQGSGWQIIQSKVSIGSGGLFGKGFLEGTQKKLAFLPAQHTDFIFPLIGEELGFVGVLIILVLFFLLLYRIVELARVSGSNFASLTAFGIASLLFGHIIVNVGMTVGLMPITGLPLPLFSYGGSFLLTCYLAVGILQRIHLERSGP